MKKVYLGFSILAASALFVLGCNKKDNIAPEPDTEFQSSVDITWANMVITDIDQICAYVGENNLYPKFYLPAPGQATINVTRDTVLKYLFISFNNTKCVDGRLRDGTIAMNYSVANVNSNYYHDFGFVGNITLINYKVDGWKIKGRNSFFITNKVAPVDYSPKTTNLSWNLRGDFDMIHPNVADSARNIHINVDYTKTLLGTSNATIFPPSKQAAINWSLATIEYKGTSFGETSRNVPFTFAFSDSKPAIRDFMCYPDKVVGVTVNSSQATTSVTSRFEEFHPFVAGAASFSTAALYPRVIHYGDEGATTYQCDNEGVVTVKGISYPVNFVKENK